MTIISSTSPISLTNIIRTTRLKFFDHIARADPSVDHRALRSSVAPFTKGLELQIRPTSSNYLHTVESDVTPLNIGLTTGYNRAQNRQACSTGPS